MSRWFKLAGALAPFLIAFAGTKAMATQSPPAAVKGLAAWYDATDSSTITTVSGAVSQVNDESGNGNTLTQGTPAHRPTLSTVNGFQAFVFSESSSEYLLSSTTNTLATGGNPSTMIVVAAFTGTDAASYYPAVVGYGTASSGEVRGMLNTVSGYAYITNYANDLDSTTLWATTPTMVFGSFGSSQEGIAVNGGTLGTVSTTPNTTSGTGLFVGCWVSTYYFWTGPIYEVLLYNSALSTAEQQFIEGYLACKYSLQGNLPASHPYKSTCPSTSSPTLSLSLSVSPTGLQSPGTDLTYTTTFTNSSGTLDYNPVIDGPVPAHTWFKVGTPSQSLGGTGLSAAVTYSNNGGSTFSYTPVSAGGGAAGGYDANVTDVRWTLGGALGTAATATTINSGSVTYVVRVI
jgi:hypothetical protein